MRFPELQGLLVLLENLCSRTVPYQDKQEDDLPDCVNGCTVHVVQLYAADTWPAKQNDMIY